MKLMASILAVSVAHAAGYNWSGYTVNVTASPYNAACNGTSDDTAAIQSAINAAAAHSGGGMVQFPASTCLLNSNTESAYAATYYNLLVPSNVFLQGSTSGTTTLLQGPGGRASGSVGNQVVVFGSQYWAVASFQSATLNGGFYTLQATTAGVASVTLATPSQASNFHVGDYVAFYDTNFTSGCTAVCPGETNQITSVNTTTGVLGLNWSVARSFASPAYIADVSNENLATYNIGMADITVQGAIPLYAEENFNASFLNNTFVVDASITQPITLAELNTMRDWLFQDDRWRIINGSQNAAYFECPERDSQTGIITGNTITASNLICGEYLAHWQVTNNTISVSPPSSGFGSAGGAYFTGLDVLFQSNVVTGTNNTGLQIPIFADWTGPGSTYGPYVGQIRVIGNEITCNDPTANCVTINGPDTVVDYNTISSNAGGVQIFSGSTVRFNSNSVFNSAAGGTGVILDNGSSQVDGNIVHGNYIYSSAGGGSNGIWVTNQSSPNTGGNFIGANCLAGSWTTPISLNMTDHPGTVVQANNCGAPVFGLGAAAGKGGVR